MNAFDSSILVAALVESERHHAEYRALVTSGPFAVWTHGRVETFNTLTSGKITSPGHRLPMSPKPCAAASVPAPHSCNCLKTHCSRASILRSSEVFAEVPSSTTCTSRPHAIIRQTAFTPSTRATSKASGAKAIPSLCILEIFSAQRASRRRFLSVIISEP